MSDSQSTNPTLTQAIESGARAQVGRMSGTLPATVLSYDRATQSAKVA